MSRAPVLAYLDKLLPLGIRLQTMRALNKLDSASVSFSTVCAFNVSFRLLITFFSSFSFPKLVVSPSLLFKVQMQLLREKYIVQVFLTPVQNDKKASC